jgi:hypothetical protein
MKKIPSARCSPGAAFHGPRREEKLTVSAWITVMGNFKMDSARSKKQSLSVTIEKYAFFQYVTQTMITRDPCSSHLAHRLLSPTSVPL